VPEIRLHDLRHTHATILLRAGEPVKAISERLGHASPMITLTV
jgi:integrase